MHVFLFARANVTSRVHCPTIDLISIAADPVMILGTGLFYLEAMLFHDCWPVLFGFFAASEEMTFLQVPTHCGTFFLHDSRCIAF